MWKNWRIEKKGRMLCNIHSFAQVVAKCNRSNICWKSRWGEIPSRDVPKLGFVFSKHHASPPISRDPKNKLVMLYVHSLPLFKMFLTSFLKNVKGLWTDLSGGTSRRWSCFTRSLRYVKNCEVFCNRRMNSKNWKIIAKKEFFLLPTTSSKSSFVAPNLTSMKHQWRFQHNEGNNFHSNWTSGEQNCTQVLG